MGEEDSQVPSLSSSSSIWSLRDSILSLRPHSSATCSGRKSSGGTGSTARTQAPACPAHCKGRDASGGWDRAHTAPRTRSQSPGSPAPAAGGALATPESLAPGRAHPVLLPELAGIKESVTWAHRPPPRGPRSRRSPATLRMLALVGGSRDPSRQVRPSGPSTRPWGQPQVKLPAVFRQRCEQRATLILHSSTSSHGKRRG